MKRTHHTALSELYKSKGVGRTVAQRLKFWESQEPGCNFSHNPTDAQKVGCFELSWLVQQFPKDFPSC